MLPTDGGVSRWRVVGCIVVVLLDWHWEYVFDITVILDITVHTQTIMHKKKLLPTFLKIGSIGQFVSKNSFMRGYSMALEASNEYNKSKMLAWQIHSYGGLEELKLAKTARIPHIEGPNDVVIQISASSVNPIDVAMMGKSSFFFFADFGFTSGVWSCLSPRKMKQIKNFA